MAIRRPILVLALAVGLAAPAHALLVAPPLAALAGGCTHDVTRTSGVDPQCPHGAPGLGGPVALAVGADRLFVAGADDDAVTALRLHGRRAIAEGGPVPRSHDCVAAAGTACARTVGGLAGADALLLSGTGRDLYVGSRVDDSVVGLTADTLRPIAGGCVSRTARSGCTQLAAQGSVGALALSADGRDLYVAGYGATSGSDTIVTLARSAATGALSADPQAPCVQSLGRAAARCPRRTPGLEGVTALAATNDGHFVYAASPISGAVVVLRRNRFTGRLSPLGGSGGCLHDPKTTAAGDHGCATATIGLRGADGLALAPSGATLFVIAGDPGSVVALTRNPTTGALTPAPGGCLTAAVVLGCTTVPQLRGAQAGALSDGGRQLIVSALGADAVVSLAVDPATGLLTPPATAFADIATLSGPGAVAAGPAAVYVASTLDDSVATLGDAPSGQ